jgi:hypothetical protein
MRVAAGFGAVVFGVFVAVAASVPAQRGTASPPASATAADATSRIVAAAQKVLSSLDEAGRAKIQFPLNSEQRTRWSNLPQGIFKREGVRLGDLTPAQKTAAMALLEAAFSASGYRKVTGTPPLGAGAAAAAAGWCSGPTSTSSRSSARHRRPTRGSCSSAATTWRSI